MRVSESIAEKLHAHCEDAVMQIADLIHEDRLEGCEDTREYYASIMRGIIGVSFPTWDEMELKELWVALGRPYVLVRSGRPWQMYTRGINSRLESPSQVALMLDRAYWAAEQF